MAVVTSLVTGTRAAQREAAIAALLDPDQSTAVILEGLSDGNDILASLSSPRLNVVHIAPGCMHCIGNLVMRVTLNRILRAQPQRLFISVANDEHIEQLRDILAAPPYDALLELTGNIVPASS